MKNLSRKFSSSCRGFLMIEVLVTLLILAVGLLGAAALQARSLQYAYASSQRTIATIQANDLVERLWASACKLPAGLGAVEALWQADWAQDGRFQGWAGGVTGTAGVNLTIYDIAIKWSDTRLSSSGTPIEQTFSYSTSVPTLACKI